MAGTRHIQKRGMSAPLLLTQGAHKQEENQMSKLLKRVIDKHMPHLSHKLTAENGYDEAKHRTVADLHKAKLINDEEKAAIDSCVDDLANLDDDSYSSNAAKVLKAVNSGEVNPDSLNDDAFAKAFMDTTDDNADSDENITA